MYTTAYLVVALLGPAAPHAAADPAVAAVPEADVVLVQDAGGEELGFVDEYFPLSLSDNIDPATDDLILPFWLSAMFLPFGWLWAPYVFADVKPGNDYLVDALLIAVFHALASACLLPCMFIPIVNIAVLIFNVINGWYLTPVAWLNAYDRSIKEKGGSGGGTAPSPKKRKRRRRPRQDALAPSASPVVMAF